MELVSAAPRVRTRNSRDRQQDQLADLAVLNERLAGDAGLVRPWEVSTRAATLAARLTLSIPPRCTTTQLRHDTLLRMVGGM